MIHVYGLDDIISMKQEIIVYNNFCSEKCYLSEIYNNITFALCASNYNISLFYNELSLEHNPTFSPTLIAQFLLKRMNNGIIDDILYPDDISELKYIYNVGNCLTSIFVLSLYIADNINFLEDYGLFLDEIYATHIIRDNKERDNIQYILNQYFLMIGDYDKVVEYAKTDIYPYFKNDIIDQLKELSFCHYIRVKYPIDYDFRTDICCICMDEMDNTTSTSKLVCGHYFHHVCISQVELCPICRGVIVYRF